eukprot:1735105-Rhodomonas_salina.2
MDLWRPCRGLLLLGVLAVPPAPEYQQQPTTQVDPHRDPHAIDTDCIDHACHSLYDGIMVSTPYIMQCLELISRHVLKYHHHQKCAGQSP